MALRALVFDPRRARPSSANAFSRAHRAASSTCKNLFLKTPLALCLRQKKFFWQAKRSVRAKLMRREAFAAPFHPPPGGFSLKADKKRRQNMIDTSETRFDWIPRGRPRTEDNR